MSAASNLRYIEGGTFKNNQKLAKVDLQDCDLEMLTEDIFGYTVSDQLQLHIHNNPWYCNCTLLWLKELWLRTNTAGDGVPSCESSSAHSNQGKFKNNFLTDRIILEIEQNRRLARVLKRKRFLFLKRSNPCGLYS